MDGGQVNRHTHNITSGSDGGCKRKATQGKEGGLQEGLMEEVALSRELAGAREHVSTKGSRS